MKTKLSISILFFLSLFTFFLVGVTITSAETCECLVDSAFGGGDPCTGGYCDGCHCSYPNGKPSVATNGTKNSGNSITPLPESSYKSLWQFQMTRTDGSKSPVALGFRNVNSPYDRNADSRGEFQLTSGNIFNCDGIADVNGVQSCDYTTEDLMTTKVYLAPGSRGSVIFTKSQGSSSNAIVMMRFGEPPQGTYDQSEIKYSYEDGNIGNTTGKDFVSTRTTSGLEHIFDGFIPDDAPGGWLYIRIIPISSTFYTIDYNAYTNYANYKTWYDSMTAQNKWGADGDPAETTPTPTTPTLPIGPDCATKVCRGNSCWNGTDTYIAGTKTTDCASGSATATPNSVTPKVEWTAEHPAQEIAYINWTSQNAKSMEVQCTGPAPIARAPIQLTSAEWQKTYTKPNVNDPNGYPGWFHVGTSGTAICTFYPTNISDGLPGTSFSTTIQVIGTPTCGNSIVEGTEECDYTPSSGLTSYVPCPTGKTCQDCKCVTPTEATRSYVCQPDDPNCAKSTCKDVKCFDGCNYQKGSKDCKGRE